MLIITIIITNCENRPDELSANGTERRLFKKRRHELVSIDLMYTTFQSAATLVHWTFLLFKHSLFWQLCPIVQPVNSNSLPT